MKRVLWAAVLLIVSTLPLAGGWSGGLMAPLFALAVVVAFGAVAGARAARVPTEIVLFGLILCGLAGGYLAARGSIGGGPVEVLRDSVPRLLTAARPAPVVADLVMPGVLLVFLVAVVVAVASAKGLFAPVCGAVVLYTAGTLLTAGKGDRYGLIAFAVVAVAAAGWLLDRKRKAPLVIPAASAALIALVAFLATALPNHDPFEPRELVRPPVTDIAVPNPLPRLANWAATPDTELLRFRGPETAVRLAVLADYTGAAWQVSSLYGPLGAVAPPDLPGGTRTRTADVEITIGALDGNWLPTIGRPTATSMGDAMVDPDSGSLVTPEGLRPGLSYDLTGVIDTPTDDDLVDATVPSGPATQRYLDLPNLPPTLAEYARQSVANTRTPYEKAVALEQVVRLNRSPDAQAPVGSSYARIEDFLYGSSTKGTAEQFATAYAVLARATGLPTRIAVGFPTTPETPDGWRVLRGIDVTAWPEVYFTNLGWVPFDPVSGTDSGPSPAAKREVLNRLASTTAQPPTPNLNAPPVVLPTAPPPTTPPPPPPAVWWPYLLLAVPPTTLATLRTLRRTRQRKAGALGAWDRVLDLLLLAGRPPAPHLPAPAIAATLASPQPKALTNPTTSPTAQSPMRGLMPAEPDPRATGAGHSDRRGPIPTEPTPTHAKAGHIAAPAPTPVDCAPASAEAGHAAVPALMSVEPAPADAEVGPIGTATDPIPATTPPTSPTSQARDTATAPAIRLAAMADQAAFASTPPPTPDAWHLAQEVHKGLKRMIPWHRRALWPLDPRPLWRR